MKTRHFLLSRLQSTASRYEARWKVTHGFYRATLYVSAVFAVARCPSVRPSVTLVDCIQTAETYRQTSLSARQPDHSSFFLPPSTDTQFQEEPLQWGRKIHGVGKFCDFRPKSPFFSETVRDRLMVAMEC